MNLAIVGATGLVGKKICEVLQERNIHADNFHLFAGSADANKKIKIFDTYHPVKQIDLQNLKNLKIDYAFFATDAKVSSFLVPEFAKRKIFCIDNSNAFRRKETVPLVAANVNDFDLKTNGYIFSNPNCSTIQLVTALMPLHKKLGLRRVIVSTYQAVSGAGQDAILDFQNGTCKKFLYPINSNLIPHIDDFLPSGDTKEEDKLVFESRKIMHIPNLAITATAVRVPVQNGHSESVNIEFEKPSSVEEIREILQNSPGVVLKDDPQNNIYPMPIFCDGKDEVFVGRIRKDFSQQNAFNLFIVADNLRRGAASNAVDIFQKLVLLKTKNFK